MIAPGTTSSRRSVPRTLRAGVLGTVLAAAVAVGPVATAVPAAAALPAAATESATGSAAPGADGARSEAVDNGRGPVPVYEAAGSEVTGGGELASATDVEPGLYRDVLDQGGTDDVREGSMRFYRLPALEEGESVHAAAVLAVDGQQDVDGNDNVGLKLEFLNPQGDSCGPNQSATAAQGSTGLPVVVAGRSDVMEVDASYGCFTDGSGRVAVKLTREGLWQSDTPVPVELRFWIEPAVDESQLAEASSEDLPPASVTASGNAAPLEGGSSFTTATAIEPDRVYAVEIRPTEVQVFKVPVEYGQRMSYRLSTGNNREASVTRIGSAAYNPLLAEPRMIGGSNSLSHLDVGAVSTANASVAVSPQEYGSYSYEALRLAGDYYITVSASAARPNREGSEPFRYELAVSLTGEPGGTTEWLADAQDQVIAGVETEGGAVQATGRGAAGGAFPTAAELGALLGGVGVGAVLVGGAWLLFRRNRRSA